MVAVRMIILNQGPVLGNLLRLSSVLETKKQAAEKELAAYKELVEKHLVRPGKLELMIMDADGSNKHQITNNGAANFAPYMFPDGKRVIFCSNMDASAPMNFDLYMINVDGTGLERITYFDQFDGFPMFTRDGKKLIFCSNRHNAKPHDTNVFVADWVD